MPLDEQIGAGETREPGFDAHAEMRRRAIQRAHRQRSQYVARLLTRLAAGVARVGRAIAALVMRVRDARTNRQAIAKLHSLDESALRDIGIRRSEIESIVHGHGTDETRTRRGEQLAA